MKTGQNLIDFLGLEKEDRERIRGYEDRLNQDISIFVAEKILDSLGDDDFNALYQYLSEKELGADEIIGMLYQKFPFVAKKEAEWIEEYKQNFDINFFLKYYGS